MALRNCYLLCERHFSVFLIPNVLAEGNLQPFHATLLFAIHNYNQLTAIVSELCGIVSSIEPRSGNGKWDVQYRIDICKVQIQTDRNQEQFIGHATRFLLSSMT